MAKSKIGEKSTDGNYERLIGEAVVMLILNSEYEAVAHRRRPIANHVDDFPVAHILLTELPSNQPSRLHVFQMPATRSFANDESDIVRLASARRMRCH